MKFITHFYYPGTNDENAGPAKSNDNDDSTAAEAKTSEDDEPNDDEEEGEGVVEIKMNLQDVLANSTLKEEHLTQGTSSTFTQSLTQSVT